MIVPALTFGPCNPSAGGQAYEWGSGTGLARRCPRLRPPLVTPYPPPSSPRPASRVPAAQVACRLRSWLPAAWLPRSCNPTPSRPHTRPSYLPQPHPALRSPSASLRHRLCAAGCALASHPPSRISATPPLSPSPVPALCPPLAARIAPHPPARSPIASAHTLPLPTLAALQRGPPRKASVFYRDSLLAAWIATTGCAWAA
jgi:hypothetical protein